MLASPVQTTPTNALVEPSLVRRNLNHPAWRRPAARFARSRKAYQFVSGTTRWAGEALLIAGISGGLMLAVLGCR